MATHLDDRADDLGLTEADFVGADDIIETPNLRDVHEGKVSLFDYIKYIPTKISEALYGIFTFQR